MEKKIRWGWWSQGQGCQCETFATPDAAIAAMEKRTGDGIERMQMAGIQLAMVEVAVTPIFILQPATKERTA